MDQTSEADDTNDEGKGDCSQSKRENEFHTDDNDNGINTDTQIGHTTTSNTNHEDDVQNEFNGLSNDEENQTNNVTENLETANYTLNTVEEHDSKETEMMQEEQPTKKREQVSSANEDDAFDVDTEADKWRENKGNNAAFNKNEKMAEHDENFQGTSKVTIAGTMENNNQAHDDRERRIPETTERVSPNTDEELQGNSKATSWENEREAEMQEKLLMAKGKKDSFANEDDTLDVKTRRAHNWRERYRDNSGELMGRGNDAATNENEKMAQNDEKIQATSKVYSSITSSVNEKIQVSSSITSSIAGTMENNNKADDDIERRIPEAAERVSPNTTADATRNTTNAAADGTTNNRNGSDRSVPGAYPVQGRAPGNFPAWGRRRLSRFHISGRQQQQRTVNSTNRDDNINARSIVEATQITDAEPIVYAQNVMPDEFEELSRGRKFQRRSRIVMGFFLLVIVLLVTLLAIFLTKDHDHEGDRNSTTNNTSQQNLCRPSDTPLEQCRCKKSVSEVSNISEVCSSENSCFELRQVLIDEKYMDDDDDSLSDPCTPQNMALLWLANEDKISFNTTATTEGRKQLKQRYILATFFFSLSGDDWEMEPDEPAWLTNDHVCDWTGIACMDNTITFIILKRKGLTGMIPKEIHLLSNLRILRLPHNRISGMWHNPSNASKVIGLQLLDLSTNDLTGNILSEIRQYSKLGVLNLVKNQVTGSIPTEIGNMQYLRLIHIQGNRISGTIPSEIGKLETLRQLFLGENELTGPIPSEMGNLFSVDKLGLDSNKLNGTFPLHLKNMQDIELFNIGNNSLSGTIPTEVGEMKKLLVFDIRRNKFIGDIPREICNLQYIEHICIDHNQALENTACSMLPCVSESVKWMNLLP